MSNSTIRTSLKEHFDTVSTRYQSALYCFNLYIHLHRTVEEKTHLVGEAQKNCDMRNDLAWILGENMEVILLNCASVYLYSIFENGRDTISLYKLLDFLRKNLSEVNKTGMELFQKNHWESFLAIDEIFLDTMDEKLGKFRYMIENDLRNYRHTIGHNFTEKKKQNQSVQLNTKNIEALINVTADVINEISIRIYSSSTYYDWYSEEISKDYRNLFFSLNRQKEVSDLFMNVKSADENIMRELNKMYRPYLTSAK